MKKIKAKLRKKVAHKLDRFTYSYLVQPLVCRVLGHEPIESASWNIRSKGMSCAFCGTDLDR